MKVALITNFPPTSGMGKYAYALYKYLNEHKMRADLISLNPYEGFRQVGEGKVITVNKRASKLNTIKNYMFNPKRIPKGYDIYHITNEWLGIYAKYNKPSIVTFHDVFLEGPGSEYAKKLPSAPRLLTRRLEWSKLYHWFGDRSKKASKLASGIICNSEFTKKNVIEVLDIEPNRIIVAYGILSDLFKPRNKADTRRRLGLPPSAKIVLSVGGEETPVKNIATVVKAFWRLQRKLKNCLLIRVGKSSSNTLALIDSLNIQNKVMHLSNLPEERLALLYNASDVLCFPVLYAGFGQPIVEAMASGCPVVASYCGSLPEVVSNAGLLVNPYDVDLIASKLEEVLVNEELRMTLIQRGLDRAKRYSLETWGGKVLEFYKRVVEES